MLKEIEIFDVTDETLVKMSGDGALLVAGNPPNPMTIGWYTLGYIWGRKILTVLVRPTRYTFQCMDQVADFSVCVLPEQMKGELQFCGSRSGRDTDKIRECGFTMRPCERAQAMYIDQSVYHFECRTVHRHWLDGSALDPGIIKRYYPEKDFHMVYYGEILGIFKK